MTTMQDPMELAGERIDQAVPQAGPNSATTLDAPVTTEPGDARHSEPLLRLTWTDPVTGCHGYLVVHTLVSGIATGEIGRASCRERV